MSEGDLDRLQDAVEDTKGLRFKVAALLFAMLGTICGMIWKEAGTAIFSLSSMIMLLFSLVSPAEFAQTRLPKILHAIAEALRKVFYRGDHAVRVMMIVLAIGGSAVICKYGITGFSLLPKYADVVVKRLGAFIAIASPIVYAASLVSKRIFAMSSRDLDASIRRYELMFYVAVVLFTATLFVSFSIFQIEKLLASQASTSSPAFPKDETTVLPGLGIEQIKYVWFVCGIWLVWIVSLGSCLVSRFFERRWMSDISQCG